MLAKDMTKQAKLQFNQQDINQDDIDSSPRAFSRQYAISTQATLQYADTSRLAEGTNSDASVDVSVASNTDQKKRGSLEPQQARPVPIQRLNRDCVHKHGQGQISTISSQNKPGASLQRKVPMKRQGAYTKKQNNSRVRKKIPQEMQLQWRVGAAPSLAIALSKEESQMAKIVSQATAYHNSMSDVFWGPQVSVNQHVFDLDGRVELFRDTSVAAASLVATGRPNSAREVMDRVLPCMDDLLRNPHPALYLILAELSLSLVKTPGSNLREEVKYYLGHRATSILGAEHPISQLLSLQMSQGRKEMLGEQIWNVVLPILFRTFGMNHYQSSTMAYCAARNMASRGQVEQAVKRIDELINRWSTLYGSNSLIVCYSKIELANILVGAGSGMKAEFVVSDALRTSDIIQAAELRNEDCKASEKRHRAASIAFPRVGGFRTLGRIHSLRDNYGAAMHYYSRAIAIGSSALGTNSATVELAQADLDKSRELELRRSLETFSLRDLPELTHVVPSPVC